MTRRHLDRAAVDGVELEYETRGAGEPIVVVHAGVFAEFSAPLMEQPALIERFRVVRYNRIGCGGSSRATGAVSVAEEAGHCRSLLHHLGIERAHIVGHSNSGNVGLQLALDAPDIVHSLALLEPALQAVPSQPERVKTFLAPAVAHYRAGDRAEALETFLRGTCGPDYRAVLDRALPGAFDEAVADAETFFGVQLPALQQWSFSREDAKRVAQPVLAVVGGRSQQTDPIWRERQELLLAWLPHVEPFVLPDTTHLMQVQNPRGVADCLAAFFSRHPIAIPA
jgi:pimeloyl-ACP methyl ester carboxylesterase